MCYAIVTGSYSFRQKDIRDIDSGDRFHMKSDAGKSWLTIKDVELNDAGLYVCMAYSSIGRIKSSAKLRVRGAFKYIGGQVKKFYIMV